MENLSHALYMAAAMLAFVLAFSVALILVNKLDAAAETITYKLDGSYYDSFSLERIIENNDDSNRSRVVGVDTIIPTLYRYYKESFAVKILDEDGVLLQYFDTTTEGDVAAAKVASETTVIPAAGTAELLKLNRQKALLSLYDVNSATNVPEHCCYMFGAPWLANINKDAKTRVDMYINGAKGYINNVLLDYTAPLGTENRNVALSNYEGRQFREVFTQYAYEGDTVTNDENEIVTLTGSKQIATKIIIIYQLLP